MISQLDLTSSHPQWRWTSLTHINAFSCLLIQFENRHKQQTQTKFFVCCLFFNEPLSSPFFSSSSTRLSPNSLVPPLPFSITSSSAHDELWITHYTFITAGLCMSTFIYILLITSTMFIHESQRWTTPTSPSDGHGDPKCPWCVATIRLPRQLINRPAHQSLVDGRTEESWRAHDTCSHL